MYHPLSLNGYSKIINAVKRQRNLGLPLGHSFETMMEKGQDQIRSTSTLADPDPNPNLPLTLTLTLTLILTLMVTK